jgi:hypothetical protein
VRGKKNDGVFFKQATLCLGKKEKKKAKPMRATSLELIVLFFFFFFLKGKKKIVTNIVHDIQMMHWSCFPEYVTASLECRRL